MKDYRTLYSRTYNIIWDRSKYDVHHIDLNHDNNDVKNLVLVPKILHHQYHFSLETLKQNFNSLQELWSVGTLDTYTSERLEDFSKFRFLMSLFYKMKFYYEDNKEKKDISDIVKVVLPNIYIDYKLGE